MTATPRNREALASFTAYCHNNPSQRFWQALRNWSRYQAIVGVERWEDGFDAAGHWTVRPGDWENTFRLDGLEGSMVDTEDRHARDVPDHDDGNAGGERGGGAAGAGDGPVRDAGEDDGAGDGVRGAVVPDGDWDTHCDPEDNPLVILEVTAAQYGWMTSVFGPDKPVLNALDHLEALHAWLSSTETAFPCPAHRAAASAPDSAMTGPASRTETGA